MMSRKDSVGHIIKALVTVVTLIALTGGFRVIKATLDDLFRRTRGTRNAWIGSPKALLRRGYGCPSASCWPLRRVGCSRGRLRGVRLAEMAHAERCATLATARTGLPSHTCRRGFRRPSHMVLG